MIEGTRAPSDRTTLRTTPNYDDSNTDEMDIEEIVERSRDFKCILSIIYKTLNVF